MKPKSHEQVLLSAGFLLGYFDTRHGVKAVAFREGKPVGVEIRPTAKEAVKALCLRMAYTP